MFGKTSRARLDTCHKDLQLIFNTAMERCAEGPVADFTILEGFRPEGKQNTLLHDGMTTLSWPNSKHNKQPSMAVDSAPYHKEVPHIHWSDQKEFTEFAKWILKIAKELKKKKLITHDLRWGGDWDQDGNPVYQDADETFFDGPHFELV